MTDLTPQSILDTVAKHLKTQRMPAHNSEGDCLYRTKTGQACAVGILLTDDEAHEMDREPDSGITAIAMDIVPERLHPHIDLLSELQAIHDNSNNYRQDKQGGPFVFNMTMVANELLQLAQKHNLTFNYEEFLA